MGSSRVGSRIALDIDSIVPNGLFSSGVMVKPDGNKEAASDSDSSDGDAWSYVSSDPEEKKHDRMDTKQLWSLLAATKFMDRLTDAWSTVDKKTNGDASTPNDFKEMVARIDELQRENTALRQVLSSDQQQDFALCDSDEEDDEVPVQGPRGNKRSSLTDTFEVSDWSKPQEVGMRKRMPSDGCETFASGDWSQTQRRQSVSQRRKSLVQSRRSFDVAKENTQDTKVTKDALQLALGDLAGDDQRIAIEQLLRFENEIERLRFVIQQYEDGYLTKSQALNEESTG